MSELVNKVAEILNAPVDLVQRSAEARAAASGGLQKVNQMVMVGPIR